MNEDAYQLALAQLLQSGQQDPVAPVMSQMAPMQMPQYQGPIGGGEPPDDAELAGIISAIGGAVGQVGGASYATGKAGPSPAADSSGGAPIGQAAQYIEPGTAPGVSKPATQLGSMEFASAGVSPTSPSGASAVQLPQLLSLAGAQGPKSAQAPTLDINSKTGSVANAAGLGGVGVSPGQENQWLASAVAGGVGQGLTGQGGLGRVALGGVGNMPLNAGGGLVGNLVPYALSYYARDKFA